MCHPIARPDEVQVVAGENPAEPTESGSCAVGPRQVAGAPSDRSRLLAAAGICRGHCDKRIDVTNADLAALNGAVARGADPPPLPQVIVWSPSGGNVPVAVPSGDQRESY